MQLADSDCKPPGFSSIATILKMTFKAQKALYWLRKNIQWNHATSLCFFLKGRYRSCLKKISPFALCFIGLVLVLLDEADLRQKTSPDINRLRNENWDDPDSLAKRNQGGGYSSIEKFPSGPCLRQREKIRAELENLDNGTHWANDFTCSLLDVDMVIITFKLRV